MAELADAPDLGSGVYDVQVQVLSSAVLRKSPYSVGVFFFIRKAEASVRSLIENRKFLW